MNPYTSSRSNIRGYEVNELRTEIAIYFKDGSGYLYTNQATGATQVAQLILLAQSGRGLNSYISRIVKGNYARKIS